MRLGNNKNNQQSTTQTDIDRGGDAVLHDRVALLHSGVNLSLGVSFLVALIFVQVHDRHDPGQGTVVWLVAISLVLGTRLAAAWLYHKRPTLLPDDQAWLRWFRNGASLTAGLWGIAGLMYFPADNAIMQAMTVLVLSGIAAGALSALAPDFSTYRNYVLLSLVPLVLLALLRAEELQLMIGLLGLLLIVFLLNSGRKNSQSIVDSLILQHENAGLIDDLEREKNRALNEAETMISTVLASAPIALWSVNSDGTVTFMQGQHLGDRTGQVLPSPGQNLLHAYEKQPQIAYETQRALNGESFITEIELDEHTFEVHYNPMSKDDGSPSGAIGVAIDVTDRVEHKRELSRRAHYDELTGLPNRTLIMNQIAHAFDNARRHKKHVGLFFLDLDNFKTVNDTMGHAAGDLLLRQAADRLRGTVRQNDMPARLGGDEFLVVSEGLSRPADAEVIAHKIAHLFQRPFDVEGREIFATTSVGVAIYPQDGETAEQLLQSADTAMYHAKAAGKNKYRFFTRQMQDTAERHLAMETELRRALERDELHLMYQPKYDCHSGRIRGAEALLRWKSPTLGNVTPDHFVPVAEFAGLMPHIGDWVLRAACREAAYWQTISDDAPHVAINVSPHQFRNTDLLANVTQALVETGLLPETLELEITESVLVQDAPETMQIFKDLEALGISLSLDDFGTGYSSLSYLKRFPIQVLKIDKAFIQDLGHDSDDDSLVDAIIAMAHSLKMQIVAEGVETQEQLQFLRQRKVELVQGYLFSPPVDAECFRNLLIDNAAIDTCVPTNTAATAS